MPLMRRRVLVIAALAVAAAYASLTLLSCSERQSTPGAAAAVCDDPRDDVRIVRDAAYGTSAKFQTLDLYVPARRAGEPVMVMVHAGGWVGGDKRVYGPIATAFAGCGIAVADINYRLAPRVRAVDQAADVLSAVRWIQTHAPAFGYAADRTFLLGHSAGAELVALGALQRRVLGNGAQAPPIVGVIAIDGTGYSPLRDYADDRNSQGMSAFYAAGFGKDERTWQRYDLLRVTRPGAPPFLVIHGIDDHFAAAADSQRLADALRTAGNRVTYLQPANRDHNSVIEAARDPSDPTALAIERFVQGNGTIAPAASAARASSFAAIAAPLPSLPRLRLPRPDHVIVIVEENHAFSEIIGSEHAPYLNQLAAQGAVFTQSFAVTHPSQPNYLALFAGLTNDNGDGCPESGVPTDAANLGSELIAAHLTFTGYSETMPGAGFTGCSHGFAKWSYVRKHNPWVDFTNVPAASNQPLTPLPSYDSLPTVAFIVPNEAHDMHSGSILEADRWLQNTLGPMIDGVTNHNTLLIVTWDEDDKSQNNQIPTIFVGPMVRPGRYDARIDHYSVLRTLEAMYGLPFAGHSREATPIADCWR